MSIFDQLREQAGLGGPAASLANEILVIRNAYEANELTLDEYQFLLQEIADIKAQQELATDEVACRWIIAAAEIAAKAMI